MGVSSAGVLCGARGMCWTDSEGGSDAVWGLGWTGARACSRLEPVCCRRFACGLGGLRSVMQPRAIRVRHDAGRFGQDGRAPLSLHGLVPVQVGRPRSEVPLRKAWWVKVSFAWQVRGSGCAGDDTDPVRGQCGAGCSEGQLRNAERASREGREGRQGY